MDAGGASDRGDQLEGAERAVARENRLAAAQDDRLDHEPQFVDQTLAQERRERAWGSPSPTGRRLRSRAAPGYERQPRRRECASCSPRSAHRPRASRRRRTLGSRSSGRRKGRRPVRATPRPSSARYDARKAAPRRCPARREAAAHHLRVEERVRPTAVGEATVRVLVRAAPGACTTPSRLMNSTITIRIRRNPLTRPRGNDRDDRGGRQSSHPPQARVPAHSSPRRHSRTLNAPAAPPAPTWNANRPKERAAEKPSAASNDSSPAPSTPPSKPNALDIGATLAHASCVPSGSWLTRRLPVHVGR